MTILNFDEEKWWSRLIGINRDRMSNFSKPRQQLTKPLRSWRFPNPPKIGRTLRRTTA